MFTLKENNNTNILDLWEEYGGLRVKVEELRLQGLDCREIAERLDMDEYVVGVVEDLSCDYV